MVCFQLSLIMYHYGSAIVYVRYVCLGVIFLGLNIHYKRFRHISNYTDTCTIDYS